MERSLVWKWHKISRRVFAMERTPARELCVGFLKIVRNCGCSCMWSLHLSWSWRSRPSCWRIGAVWSTALNSSESVLLQPIEFDMTDIVAEGVSLYLRWGVGSLALKDLWFLVAWSSFFSYMLSLLVHDIEDPIKFQTTLLLFHAMKDHIEKRFRLCKI